ncbi:MAG: hypothetical protein L6R35_002317 [Caloplaca aegaea]|nr:MAG: hypothetical protein L6R35_002317 [Caloplaca aegaea]
MGNAPFIYDHPAKYSFTGPTDKAWDPKAVSRASYAASLPQPPRPKQQGPLIDAKEFNRHPDSYFVVHPRYNRMDYPSSGKRSARTSAVSLTVEQPGVAIMHTIYAIYHLARSANARTPTSSASYMIFAAILDAGLIPFLVFTAIFAHDQYGEPSSTPGHWASLFMFDTATTKIVRTTYLTSVVNGTLHVVSLMTSIYLAVLFRKISKLPPDMNPLEDNLTSRHKRNKSELLDDRNSQANIGISSKRGSRVEEPLISPVRSVPFMHTRNGSSVNINSVPHPHFSPRASCVDTSAPFYDQPPSNRSSRVYDRPQTLYSQQQSHNTSQTNFSPSPTPNQQYRDPYPASPPPESTLLRSATKSSSIYTDDIASTRPTSTRPLSTRPFSTAPSLPPPSEYSSTYSDQNDNGNWITHPSPPPSPPIEFKHLLQSNPYQPLPQQMSPRYKDIQNRTPRPLEMNPPTPVDARFNNPQPSVREPRTTIDQRALMPGTGNTLGLTRGQQRLNYNPPVTKEVHQAGGYGELSNAKSRGNGGEGYGPEKGERVISRSGAEYGGSHGMGIGRGVRAIEVSGKMVEEGRGRVERGWGVAR